MVWIKLYNIWHRCVLIVKSIFEEKKKKNNWRHPVRGNGGCVYSFWWFPAVLKPHIVRPGGCNKAISFARVNAARKSDRAYRAFLISRVAFPSGTKKWKIIQIKINRSQVLDITFGGCCLRAATDRFPRDPRDLLPLSQFYIYIF